MAFARVSSWQPPAWPQESVASAPRRAVDDLGARRPAGGGERFHVYADPAGHPFCLVSW
ncbi:VOC family protein [Lentzea atacamensis]|uniref:VOC family protein n=1 Tax=Lentzea atacamensis TaxID=531938 RepID=UPI0014745C58|nr:VOC family protein [Lentzea atacamensis]